MYYLTLCIASLSKSIKLSGAMESIKDRASIVRNVIYIYRHLRGGLLRFLRVLLPRVGNDCIVRSLVLGYFFFLACA